MIPMRISVDKTDPSFAKFAELVSDGYRIRVTLDGVEVPGIVTADEEKGEVIAHRYTPEGNVVAVGDCVVYDRLKGEVKIIIDRPNDTRVLH
jgi:hypothetical protein